MGRQRPASVTSAIRVQWAVLLVTGVTALLTIVQRDLLVDTWAARQPPGSQPPAFAPVAIVLYVTFALLAAVLVVFFRAGHNSARISLTGLAVFVVFTMVVIWRLDPPGLFLVLAVVAALLTLLLVALLWHRDTSAYLAGAEIAAGRPADSSAVLE